MQWNWLQYALLVGVALFSGSLRAQVVVSVPPLVSVVQAIAGDAVSVRSFLPVGGSCHAYQPRPSDLKKLEDATVFFAVGVDYEIRASARLQAQFPAVDWIDLREGLPLLRVTAEEVSAETRWDPHWWLDPQAMRQAGQRIVTVLSTHYPEEAAGFAARYETWAQEVAAWETALAARLASAQGQAFLVYHGAWAYPADRFGLRQLVLAPSTAGTSPRRLQAMLAELEATAPRFVLVQPQEPHGPAETVARALKTPLVECDPLQPDWQATLNCWVEAVENHP